MASDIEMDPRRLFRQFDASFWTSVDPPELLSSFSSSKVWGSIPHGGSTNSPAPAPMWARAPDIPGTPDGPSETPCGTSPTLVP